VSAKGSSPGGGHAGEIEICREEIPGQIVGVMGQVGSRKDYYLSPSWKTTRQPGPDNPVLGIMKCISCYARTFDHIGFHFASEIFS